MKEPTSQAVKLNMFFDFFGISAYHAQIWPSVCEPAEYLSKIQISGPHFRT